MVKFKIEISANEETRMLVIGDKEFKWTLKEIPSKQMKLNFNETVEIVGEADNYGFETQIWLYDQRWCEDDDVYEAFELLNELDSVEEIQKAIKTINDYFINEGEDK